MPLRRGTISLLAIAAAAAALASFAVPGASATNLCSEAPNGANECPVGNAYTAGQTFEAISDDLIAETEFFGGVSCEESTIKFKVTELKLALAAGELQELTLEECEDEFAEECNLGFRPLPAKVRILTLGAGDGELFFEAKGGVFFEVACGVFAFDYTAPELETELSGGTPASFAFEQTLEGVMAAAGEAELKGTYTTTNPKPVWVTK